MSREADVLLRWLSIAWHRGVQDGKAIQAARGVEPVIHVPFELVDSLLPGASEPHSQPKPRRSTLS